MSFHESMLQPYKIFLIKTRPHVIFIYTNSCMRRSHRETCLVIELNCPIIKRLAYKFFVLRLFHRGRRSHTGCSIIYIFFCNWTEYFSIPPHLALCSCRPQLPIGVSYSIFFKYNIHLHTQEEDDEPFPTGQVLRVCAFSVMKFIKKGI